MEHDTNQENMTEEEFEAVLAEAIEDYVDDNDLPGTEVQTFDAVGLLTRNRGLVVRIGRAEFQLTIVRSR